MNGNQFIKEVEMQTMAIKYMGECLSSVGTSFDDFCKCEKRMLNFLKQNVLELSLVLDCYGYNPNWSNTTKIAKEMIDLFDAGDYDEFLLVLTKNHTYWKHRKALEKINITMVNKEGK